MPVHDRSRVDDGIFHDFHTVWMGELRTLLNSGLLPADYYALAEQVAGSIGPDVLTLHAPEPPAGNGAPREIDGAVAVAELPPQVHLTMKAVEDAYVHKQRTLVIRHASNHRVVALLEILSAGKKSSQHALDALVTKALAALDRGIHLLLVDLHAPGSRNPQGIHGVIWEELTGKSCEQPPDKPLTLVAYAADTVKTAYVEPLAVGDALKEMPLFLTPDQYVNVDLEGTYRAAYRGVPRVYRERLEESSPSREG